MRNGRHRGSPAWLPQEIGSGLSYLTLVQKCCLWNNLNNYMTKPLTSREKRSRSVVAFSRVPEVSFVSWGIRCSRSYKPDSEFGGRSTNPPFIIWLGTRPFVLFGRFDSGSSRTPVCVYVKNTKQAELIRFVWWFLRIVSMFSFCLRQGIRLGSTHEVIRVRWFGLRYM